MRSSIATDSLDAFRQRLAQPRGRPLHADAAPWIESPPSAALVAELAALRARLNKPRGVPLAYFDALKAAEAAETAAVRRAAVRRAKAEAAAYAGHAVAIDASRATNPIVA